MRRAVFFLFLLLVVQIPFAGNMFIADGSELPEDTIPSDTIPSDTIPTDTIPTDTIPSDTIPTDTIPTDTIPTDTIPTDTIPSDTTVQIKMDTIAKVFKQGEFTRACFPFKVDTSQIKELYRVARIDDNMAVIYPVGSVDAGQPFVGRIDEDINEWVIADSLTDWTAPTDHPLLWAGGTIKGDYADFGWRHTELNGDTDTLTELTYQLLDPQELHFNVNLENVQVRRYLQFVHYTDSTPSQVRDYCDKPFVKGDSPNPVSIPFPYIDQDSVTVVCTNMEDATDTVSMHIAAKDQMALVYNLTPQCGYRYSIHTADTTLAVGTFHTEGFVRMIHAPGIKNIRDLGGWQTTDGKRIKYGRLYRGGELNGQHTATPEAIQMLKDVGIQAEIDLRAPSEHGGISVFGFIGSDYNAPDGLKTYYFTNNSGCELAHMSSYYWQIRWRREFEYIVNNLKLDRPVYYHCIWGADRTGFLSMLLEGILGIPYDQIAKDYELTSFTDESIRQRESQYKLIGYILALDGNTLQEKFNTYMTKQLIISQADIDYFTREMVGEGSVTLGIASAPDTALPKARPEGFYDLHGRKATPPLQKGIYIKIDEHGIGRKHIAQ